mgnify:CR=1 FL=1
MKSILRFCTLLFCSLLVAMISAPAALLAGVVSHFSQQRITLADADGFWWRGSAWVSVSQPGQSALTMPGRLQWEFEPSPTDPIHLFLLMKDLKAMVQAQG